MKQKLSSYIHHHRVKNSHISLDAEIAFSIDWNKFHRHVFSWDPNLIERAPTIVLAVVSHLWAHITRADPRQWHPSIQVSERHDERHDTIILSIDYQSAESHGVRTEISQISRPPLRGSRRWRLDDELISTLVKSGCGLYASNIGSMADLSLCVCAHDSSFPLKWFPLFALLVSAHVYNSEWEHCIVEDTWTLTECTRLPMDIIAFMLHKPLFFPKRECSVVLFHLMLPHFLPGHVVEFMSIPQNGIPRHESRWVPHSL